MVTVSHARTSLVDTLERRQAELGMDDQRFAEKLGVSRPAWSMVRAGKRRIGQKFLANVMRAFPSLTDDCLAYLRDRRFSLPKTVTVSDISQVTEEAVA